MKVFWKVRCFNRSEKSYFDRELLLDTLDLEPVTRNRVELAIQARTSDDRGILGYRHLFQEVTGESQVASFMSGADRMHMLGVGDYFEDERGSEITITEVVRIKEGRDDIVVLPSRCRPHDIILYRSQNSPIPDNPQDHIKLSQDEIDSLAYFVRDAAELIAKAFYETPPALHSVGGVSSVETLPVEQIIAFVTVFRRMYMNDEKGNYDKACIVYARHFLNKRLTEWITAERRSYNRFLRAKARLMVIASKGLTFPNRMLINAFLCTRFAHQPKDDTSQQYKQCLQEVGDEPRLEWMFYMTIWEASLYYSRAYNILSSELAWYLKAAGASATFDATPFRNEMGRGEQLTAEQIHEQRLQAQAEKLGRELWQQAGSPAGQLECFVAEAESKLRT